MRTITHRSTVREIATIFGLAIGLATSFPAPAQSPAPPIRNAAFRPVTDRQRIRARLDRIVIPQLAFDNVPLPEVIRFIQAEAIKNDPDHRALNFMLNSYLVELPSAPASAAPAAAPTTPPAPAPAPPPTDLDNVLIKIDPPLHDLKLSQALDAIMKAANSPIRFNIEDYAIVFFRSSPEAAALISRGYRVNPNTFQQGLQGVVSRTIATPGGNGSGGQNSSSGITIPAVNVAPGGGGISGVTSPANPGQNNPNK